MAAVKQLPQRLLEYVALFGVPEDVAQGSPVKASLLLQQPETADVARGIEMFAFFQPVELVATCPTEIPCFHSFVLTHEDGKHLYAFCISKWDPFPMPEGMRYAPRVIVAVSYWPYHETFKKIFAAFCNDLPRDAVFDAARVQSIYSLLASAPFPKPGQKCSLRVCEEEITYAMPDQMDMPLCEVDFRPLFTCLSPQNMISALCAMICEAPTVFVTSQPELLTPCMEALVALMYPLQPIFVYITVLPPALLDLLQAPTPFVYGVQRRDLDMLELDQNVTVVDLDNNTVRVPPRVPMLPTRFRRKLLTCIKRHALVFAQRWSDREAEDEDEQTQAAADVPNAFITQRTLSILYSSSESSERDAKANDFDFLLSTDVNFLPFNSSGKPDAETTTPLPSEMEALSVQPAAEDESVSDDDQSVTAEPKQDESTSATLVAQSEAEIGVAPPTSPSPTSEKARTPVSALKMTHQEDSIAPRKVSFASQAHEIGDEDEHEPAAAKEASDSDDDEDDRRHNRDRRQYEIPGTPTARFSGRKDTRRHSRTMMRAIGGSNQHERNSQSLVNPVVRVSALRRVFCGVFVSLLKTYQEFLTISLEDDELPDQLIDEVSFLASLPEDSVRFMRALLETQMFIFFLQDRITHQRDIFDERVQDKLEHIYAQLQFFAQRRMKGVFYKMGRVVKNWKRRAYEINGQDLSYFIPETGVKRGSFKLVPGQSSVTIPTTVPKAPTENALEITVPGRRFVLCTDTRDERRELLRLIKAKIHPDPSRFIKIVDRGTSLYQKLVRKMDEMVYQTSTAPISRLRGSSTT